MVARPAICAESLRSGDAATQLRVVRELKNAVIGNRFKKLEYLHLVPPLLQLLDGDGDGDAAAPPSPAQLELRVQATSALGSLAYGVEDGVRAIVAANGVAALLAALGSPEPRVVVAAARSLKLVYQSPLAPHEPLLAAPTLQRLVWLLQQPPQATVATAAASVLGHCCTNAEEARLIVGAGALPALVPLLLSPPRAMQEAALEALGTITQHSLDACQQLLALNPSQLQQQQQQAQQQQQQAAPPPGPGQPAATPPPHPQLAASGGVLALLLGLSKQRDARLRFLVARCLSNLRRWSEPGSAASKELLAAGRSVLPPLVRLLAGTGAAATEGAQGLLFLTHHTHAYPGAKSQSGRGAEAGPAAADDRAFLLEVPEVLAQLMGDSDELLALAVELEAVKQLIQALSTTASAASEAAAAAATASSNGEPGPPAAVAASSAPLPAASSSAAVAAAAKAARAAAAKAAAAATGAGLLQLRRGCLLALAALAMGGDVARQQMVDGRLVPLVVAALGDPSQGVRAAAAACLRGLSRSVRLLRSSALPCSIAGPLVALLQDNSASEAQVAAAGAACNLVLGFSSCRAALIKAGVLPALAPCLSSMLPELRHSAAWALKNLAFEADGQLQASLASELGWAGLAALLGDDDPRVRGQAIGLLQNLCRGGEGLDRLLQWSNGQLLPLLEQQLQLQHYQPLYDAAAAAAADAAGSGAGASSSAAAAAAAATGAGSSAQLPAEARQQLARLRSQLVGLLYCTANVCCGYERHKAAVMATGIPRALLSHLQRGKLLCAGRAHGGGDAGSDADVGGTGSGSAAAGGDAALDDAWEVALAAVWCVINLLWWQEPGSPDARRAATPSAAGGGGDATMEGTEEAQQQQQAAAEGGGGGDGSDGGLAAVAARASALRELGFERVLRELLGPTAGASSAAGVTAAAAGVALPPACDAAAAGSLDLTERVQTALEQLRVR